jgi:hypothetical protein
MPQLHGPYILRCMASIKCPLRPHLSQLCSPACRSSRVGGERDGGHVPTPSTVPPSAFTQLEECVVALVSISGSGVHDGKSYNLTMTIAVTSALRFRAQNAGSTAYTSFEQNALIFSLPSLTVAPRAGRRYRRVHCWFCVCSAELSRTKKFLKI